MAVGVHRATESAAVMASLLHFTGFFLILIRSLRMKSSPKRSVSSRGPNLRVLPVLVMYYFFISCIICVICESEMALCEIYGLKMRS